jgi:hypothetical protein
MPSSHRQHSRVMAGDEDEEKIVVTDCDCLSPTPLSNFYDFEYSLNSARIPDFISNQ